MECRIVSHLGPSGPVTVIVCGSRRKPKLCKCGRQAVVLCDGKKEDGRTCDADICRTCATHAGPNVDYCKKCAESSTRSSAAMPPREGQPPSAQGGSHAGGADSQPPLPL